MEGVLRKFTAFFRRDCRENPREQIVLDGLDYTCQEIELDLMMENEINPNLHRPVLLQEVLNYLDLVPGKVVVDCTIGGGAHAQAILERILPGGFLVGIDLDEEALNLAQERLKQYKDSFRLIQGNFKDLKLILGDLNITQTDGFLFDLGVSSYQLNDITRGFSFRSDGPLDMRMDRTQKLTAYDLVNHLDEQTLGKTFQDYAQERFAQRIAHQIILERRRKNIQTTQELVKIILRAIPRKFHAKHLHPATRTFQALRIAVNNELANLSDGLDTSLDLISKGGRIVVISFHSLEDRIVKNKFRQFANQNTLKIITKKPIIPSKIELISNPGARSAKLRVGERL